jgi:hypothetical protein
METNKLMEAATANRRRIEEELQRLIALRDRWRKIVDKTREEAKKFRKEAIRPRNIDFDSPTHHRLLATPKDNMKKATELLAQDNDQIDLEHLRMIVATTLKHQIKVDTSRKIESNPDACLSTA